MAISGIKYNSLIQALKGGLGAILLVSPNEVDTTTSGEPHHYIELFPSPLTKEDFCCVGVKRSHLLPKWGNLTGGLAITLTKFVLFSKQSQGVLGHH